MKPYLKYPFSVIQNTNVPWITYKRTITIYLVFVVRGLLKFAEYYAIHSSGGLFNIQGKVPSFGLN